MAEGGAAQVVHGLERYQRPRDLMPLQVGVAGAQHRRDATHIVLQQAQVVFVQVAGQANRNPGFNGDRGPSGAPSESARGTPTAAVSPLARWLGCRCRAQADELAIRIAFGKEDGVENREESAEMRRKAEWSGELTIWGMSSVATYSVVL